MAFEPETKAMFPFEIVPPLKFADPYNTMVKADRLSVPEFRVKLFSPDISSNTGLFVWLLIVTSSPMSGIPAGVQLAASPHCVETDPFHTYDVAFREAVNVKKNAKKAKRRLFAFIKV